MPTMPFNVQRQNVQTITVYTEFVTVTPGKFRLKQAKLTLNSNWLDFECDCVLSLFIKFRRCVTSHSTLCRSMHSISPTRCFATLRFNHCVCQHLSVHRLLYALANCLHSSVYQSAITNNWIVNKILKIKFYTSTHEKLPRDIDYIEIFSMGWNIWFQSTLK